MSREMKSEKKIAIHRYLYWLYGPKCYPRDND